MDKETAKVADAVKISVIIPTYNGAHRIMNVLRSMERQLMPADEVVVVIDGSTDGTAALLRQEEIRIGNLRIIEQENGGRAQVRNRGARAAGGDLLLFMDDDMIAPDNWIQEHVRHHRQYPDSLLTGRLDNPDKHPVDDFLKFRYWLHRKWSGTASLDQQDCFLMQEPYITANNFSAGRAVFERLGGFDERLTDAEDYDLAQRALLLQIPVYFSNIAFAWNNDTDNVTCIRYVKRIRQYAAAQQVLETIKPEIYGTKHPYTAAVPSGWKGYVFSLLCSRWWIDSVDKGFWRWLPESVRYKLYDMVITANGTFFPHRVTL